MLRDAPVVTSINFINEFGMREYRSLPWIDKFELKNAKDPDKIRQSDMESILQGWGQSLEADFLYATKDNERDDWEEVNGINYYCSALDGNRVIDGGASTVSGKKVMSIYLVAWDVEMGAFVFVPSGNSVDVKYNILGDAVISDPNDATKHLFVEQYELAVSVGFGVKDKHAIARIANIDVTNVSGITFNPELLIKAIDQFPTELRSKVVIYVPHEIELAIQMAAKSNSNSLFVYGQKELHGETLATFNGIPMRVTEAIVPQTAIVV